MRILYGRHRFVQQNDADFEASIRDLADDLPHDADIRLHACRMETSNHETALSWNHAKLVAADGRRVIPALAVGRLGSGVLPDPRVANVGAAVAAIAFRQAREAIRISQMDFGFHWEGVNFWSADVVSALADVLTDPARRVEVSLVLSEPGAKTAAGGPYSLGTTIVAEMRREIGDRPLSGSMRIAPLRFSAHSDRWAHDGVALKIINHAKIWIVDDRAFHVGSDNLYPHNLQEFGTVIESEELVRDLVSDYWNPLWGFSGRAAFTV